MHDKPRHEYYAFAHQAIPEIFFNDPKKFFDALKEYGPIFPQYIWGQMEKLAQPDYESHVKEIEVDFSEINQVSVALLTLPTPSHPTEAYFIALLHHHQAFDKEEFYQFLTLEYGVKLNGEAYTVLCEWENHELHLNLGAGSAPTKEAFLQKIEERILTPKEVMDKIGIGKDQD